MWPHRSKLIATMATKEIPSSSSSTVEYRSLDSVIDKLTNSVSADPLVVALKCVSEGLVPNSLLDSMRMQGKLNKVKATELVSAVLVKVESFPNNFKKFLAILKEFIWLQDVIDLIETNYQELKKKEKVLFLSTA